MICIWDRAHNFGFQSPSDHTHENPMYGRPGKANEYLEKKKLESEWGPSSKDY